MTRNNVLSIAAKSIAVALMLGICGTWAQNAKTSYPSMAPIDQYLMKDRNAEIALARSAAPESVARDAEVLVLGHNGYETAVRGKNGFVCIVERSWTAPLDEPDFWNPKVRAPLCLNAPAARSYLPRTIKKTTLILAGDTKNQMMKSVMAAIDNKELPAIESGAICYMLSKQGYLNDRGGHWRPHVMFFVSKGDPAKWGANLPGSPILASVDPREHYTTFMIPVQQWSDGTPVESEK